MKKIAYVLLLLALALPIQVQANVLFEHREQTQLSRDVFYEQLRQVTTAGFLDIHTLRIPLNDPYITLAPLESGRELGMRETVFDLLNQAGAIAGTNADFFGMAGSHTLSFGPVISDGQLMSITANINQGQDEFAAFLLTEQNFPLIRYVRPRIWFTLNGMELVRINAINKVSSLDYPVIITRQGMENTAQLSGRAPNLRKVVIEGGIVTRVAEHPVTVPENGFVVVMDLEHANRLNPSAWIGLSAHYEVFGNIEMDLSQIQTSIGGGGLILQNGQLVTGSGTVVAGRHPRTALGITADKQHIILMTVDGRGHSIGATHEDLANLMRRHGVSDAMHFDGGGSSTMVAQLGGPESNLQVVNRVSDGSQRRVINALGVFDNSTPSIPTHLELTPNQIYVPRGGSITVNVYALDAYLHRVLLDSSAVAFSAYTIDPMGQMQPATGTWQGNTYVPDTSGALFIQAQYGNLTGSRTYLVQDIVALQFKNTVMHIMEDMALPLSVEGITASGFNAALDSSSNQVQFTVNPPELGFVMEHTFIPRQSGIGYISAFMGSVQAHMPITVGGLTVPLHQFRVGDIQFASTPTFVTGRSGRAQGWMFLEYTFQESTETQAAYVVFDPPLVIPDDPIALSLHLRGDNSGNWLRGRVVDSQGQRHNIDFARVIDFSDIRTVTANLPGTGPYTLEQIYVASTHHGMAQTNALFFGTLDAVYSIENTIEVPPNTQFSDPIRAVMTAAAPGNAHDFSVRLPGAGRLAYSARQEGQAALLQISGAGGGIFASDRNQWARFLPDINSMLPSAVVIQMDVNPLRTLSNDEFQLFHQALITQHQLGRTVLVVSNSERASTFNLMDGIRYIDVGQAGVNSAMRFRMIDGQIWYDF